ncbi:MAG TPA: phosphoribosylamine--glycine ligase [Candidatus Acidoferrales bacterium]|jgi:phosphoribosylamine--glycine ligase|nr:phosphoribosylamine--glycine ligase [Candidatus Acidoferrales bacterium]
MKILVIGGGGREHAIVWKLARSASVEKVWCAPGNAGIAADAECLPLDVKDPRAAADLAAKIGADLTVVGPEVPLVAGIADEFAKRGLPLLGPAKAAAQLEGSKIFAKQFMERHGIPTAGVYGICGSAAEAYAALEKVKWPLVIKADGLCAGKGVLVTASEEEARAFIERVMERREFGDAGTRLLLEETLVGDELSYIILTDGTDFIRMAPARDHKRAYDNDEGPNTGGMGVYSTDEILPVELEERIIDTIVRPTLDALKADRMPYRGFLYFGLMLTRDGPQVLEYNCRLGDPETEAVLLRADFDFGQACMQAATGSLLGFDAKWARGASVCVVIASKGYPGDPQTGVAINGLDDAAKVPGAVVFHAGTKQQGATCVTNGGRVLVVSAAGETLEDARVTAYEAVRRIRIDGSFHRTDIGPKNLERKKDVSSAKTAR